MTVHRLALALVLACSMVPLACEQRSEPVSTEGESLDISPPPLAEIELVVGDLLSVDTDEKTFKVVTEDKQEHEFHYSDATVVSGESGMQALTGREGARLTVHYRQEADGTSMASRIEVAS
jgi:hypothetical protein